MDYGSRALSRFVTALAGWEVIALQIAAYGYAGN